MPEQAIVVGDTPHDAAGDPSTEFDHRRRLAAGSSEALPPPNHCPRGGRGYSDLVLPPDRYSDGLVKCETLISDRWTRSYGR